MEQEKKLLKGKRTKAEILALEKAGLLGLLPVLLVVVYLLGDMEVLPFKRGIAYSIIAFIVFFYDIIAGVIHFLGKRQKKRLIDNAGASYYKHDNAWNSRRASNQKNTEARLRFISIIAAAIFIALLHVMVYMRREYLSPWSMTGIGIMDAVLLGTLYKELRAAKLRRLIGKGVLLLGRFPFFLGERFDAVFKGGKAAANITEAKASLRCIQETARGFWHYKKRKCYQVYLTEQTISTDATSQASVSFSLPTDVPSTLLSQNPPTYWELLVTIPLSGKEHEFLFLVPIYARRK